MLIRMFIVKESIRDLEIKNFNHPESKKAITIKTNKIWDWLNFRMDTTEERFNKLNNSPRI